jgi:hypothetical protein
MRSRGSRRRIAPTCSVRQVRSPVITRTHDVEMAFGNVPALEEVLRVLAEIEFAVNG